MNMSLVAFDRGDGEPGPINVAVCPTCRALILTDANGKRAHEAWHHQQLAQPKDDAS